MSWWLWMVAGLILGALEVAAPAWVFLGFALGAIAVGVLLWVGGPLAAVVGGSLALQLLTFAALSLAAWAGLRVALGAPKGQATRIDRDINDG